MTKEEEVARRKRGGDEAERGRQLLYVAHWAGRGEPPLNKQGALPIRITAGASREQGNT